MTHRQFEEYPAAVKAVIVLMETFPNHNLSKAMQDSLVQEMAFYSSEAIARAVQDFRGLSTWTRDPFKVGKFPSMDELMPRVRWHSQEISRLKDIKSRPFVNLPPPAKNGRDAAGILAEKRDKIYEGRQVIGTASSLEHFVNGRWPVGSSWDYATMNVYGPKGGAA